MSGTTHGHQVEFYETDEVLVRCVLEYMAPVLRRGEPALVVATPEHREMFSAAFRRSGIDLDDAQDQGQYVVMDAADTLSRFMAGAHPNPDAYLATVGELVRATRGAGPSIHIYGEMVALLWKDGNPTAALELEDLWNSLADQQAFDLLCAYQTSLFDPGAGTNLFWQVCECHSDARFSPTGSVSVTAGPSPVETDLQSDIEALRLGIKQALKLGQLAEGVVEIDTSRPDGFAYALRSPHSRPEY